MQSDRSAIIIIIIIINLLLTYGSMHWVHLILTLVANKRTQNQTMNLFYVRLSKKYKFWEGCKTIGVVSNRDAGVSLFGWCIFDRIKHTGDKHS